MKKENTIQKSHLRGEKCIDVFHAFLVSDAMYAGRYEFPVIAPIHELPNCLIAFSECFSTDDYNQWVHFYEEDFKFERIWNNPSKYLNVLKKYRGVILPDFSLYRDMPFAMQVWNIYRSRAIGNWMQKNGIKVIPNVRFGDERTFQICCDGIASHSVISVGSLGTVKRKNDRYYFIEGLKHVVRILKPSNIIFFGNIPNEAIKLLNQHKIKYCIFVKRRIYQSRLFTEGDC